LIYNAEEKAAYEKFRDSESNEFLGAKEDFLAYVNTDVIPHFPPQLIIGK
jgi:hypothetical protein